MIIKNIDELSKKVASFLPFLKENNLFLIKGQMGIGKTTFVQELLKQMGVEQLEGSPTYSLINSYQTKDYGNVHHLDLYRLKKLEEVYDIGLEELMDENAYLFIEWPDLMVSLISDSYCEMNFVLLENGARKLEILIHE